MEYTKLELRKLFIMLYLIVAEKDGVNCAQLSSQAGVNYNTARGNTGQVIRPNSDVYSYQEGSGLVNTEEPRPGVSHVMITDAVGRTDVWHNNQDLTGGPATSMHSPDSYHEMGASAETVATPIYDCDMMTMSQNASSNVMNVVDTSTGLTMTTASGVQEDRTTAATQNPQAPDQDSPTDGDQNSGSDTPIPPPQGRLTNERREYYLKIWIWIQSLRKNGGNAEDVKRLHETLEKLENAMGEDLIAMYWSWLARIWSEGLEALKELEGDDEADSGASNRGRDPDKETIATNDNMDDAEVTAFKQDNKLTSAYEAEFRKGQQRAVTEERQLAAAQQRARRAYRDMTAATTRSSTIAEEQSGGILGELEKWFRTTIAAGDTGTTSPSSSSRASSKEFRFVDVGVDLQAGVVFGYTIGFHQVYDVKNDTWTFYFDHGYLLTSPQATATTTVNCAWADEDVPDYSGVFEQYQAGGSAGGAVNGQFFHSPDGKVVGGGGSLGVGYPPGLSAAYSETHWSK